jgi:DNA polymerase-4
MDEFDSKRDVGLPHRKIIHIDMDAFYASVEQRDNPELRGKAVAVGGSEERGVVAAASYEARKFGVRSAMASVTAKRQCPDLIFVEPRFEVYKAISLQIREIFAEHTPIIEPLSLDEAYLDVTENIHGIPLARDIALRIREKIKVQTGLNASAGISYNKFLAKLASDHRKPNGQYVISPEMGPTFVETLPVERFHGVGPVTAEKFNALGIYTGLDIRAQSMTFLQEHFGKAGAYYYLCLSQIKSGHICDAVRQGPDGKEYALPSQQYAIGAILIQGQVRARLIIVIHIRLEHMTKMPLAEHNNVVKAFPSDRTDQSLSMSVLPRGTW